MYVKIAADNVDRAWGIVAPWIAHAIEGDVQEELEFVREQARAGTMQIWTAMKDGTRDVEIVLVTEGKLLKGKRTLVLRLLAGSNIERHAIDFEMLENWAWNMGFEALEIWGRKGWEKRAAPLGFKYSHTVLHKVIARGLH